MSDTVKVVIAYSSTEPAKVGKTVDMDREEARVLVEEGRARYAEDDKPAAKPAAAKG